MLSFLMTKQGAIAGAVVLVLVVAAAWVNGLVQAAEARGQAELLARQAEIEFEAIVDSLNGVWVERAKADSLVRRALRDSLASKDVALARARESGSRAILDARNTISALSDSLGKLTEEDLVVIGAALDSLEGQNRLCDGALDTCQQLVKASDARIWDLEEQGRQKDAVMHQQAFTIDWLQKIGRPKMGTVGYVAAAIAAVEGVVLIVLALTGG